MTREICIRSHYWIVSLIIAAAVITTGCIPVPVPGPYVETVENQPPTEPVIVKASRKPINNLAIAGVTSALSPLTREQRGHLSDELLAALRAEHPSITFLTHYDIETLIGPGLHQQILDEYQISGNLQGYSLGAVAPAWS